MIKFKPFGYKIDYDKSIADDEREIALYESTAVKIFSATLNEQEIEWVTRSPTTAFFIMMHSTHKQDVRLQALGITLRDLACAAFYEDHTPSIPLSTGPIGGGPDFRNGQAASAILDAVPILTSETRKSWLKKAKARLARHKRNKLEHGAQS